jgi:hypothetical protein
MGGLALGVHQAFGNRLEAVPSAGCPTGRPIKGRKAAAPVDQNLVGENASGGNPVAGEATAVPAYSHPSARDLDVLSRQLGRPVRDVVEIPARCVCGNPLVAATSPRLSNGTPFPTTFYLTHPVITSAVSRLEAAGLMNEMNEHLTEDSTLAANYRAAHEAYLVSRAEIGERSGIGTVPEIDGISAGGMPTRVKCLHVLVGHSLAAGRGSTRWVTRPSQPSANGGRRTAATATAPGTPGERRPQRTSAATDRRASPTSSAGPHLCEKPSSPLKALQRPPSDPRCRH